MESLMKDQIIPIARIDAPVLIIGERGTEKKDIARAIHDKSHRSGGPFIEVLCNRESVIMPHSQSPEDVRQSVIFRARKGTLFLNEVHLLSKKNQDRLLQFLIRGVQAGKKITRKDVRLIAASSENLLDPTNDVDFKRELVHRLNIHSIVVPALRETKKEVPQLAEYYLEKYSKELSIPKKELTSSAKDKLMRYDWPGNLCELQDVIQKCMIQCNESVIDDEHLDIVPSLYDADFSFQELKAKFLAHFEKDYITRLITEHRGNISKAAEAAQMDRRYFYRLMKKYKISRKEIVNRLKNHTISYRDIWEVDMGAEDEEILLINKIDEEQSEIEFEELVEDDDIFEFISIYEENNSIG